MVSRFGEGCVDGSCDVDVVWLFWRVVFGWLFVVFGWVCFYCWLYVLGVFVVYVLYWSWFFWWVWLFMCLGWVLLSVFGSLEGFVLVGLMRGDDLGRGVDC